MRKFSLRTCVNKSADQPRDNRAADQCLYFRYKDSTIPLLSQSESSSLWPSSVVVQSGLCRTWSETPKAGLVLTRLKTGIGKHMVITEIEEMLTRCNNVNDSVFII